MLKIMRETTWGTIAVVHPNWETEIIKNACEGWEEIDKKSGKVDASEILEYIRKNQDQVISRIFDIFGIEAVEEAFSTKNNETKEEKNEKDEIILNWYKYIWLKKVLSDLGFSKDEIRLLKTELSLKNILSLKNWALQINKDNNSMILERTEKWEVEFFEIEWKTVFPAFVLGDEKYNENWKIVSWMMIRAKNSQYFYPNNSWKLILKDLWY